MVNSKKIRHLVILDIDEMKRSKLGMKTKKMVKMKWISYINNVEKESISMNHIWLESQKGERENEAV